MQPEPNSISPVRCPHCAATLAVPLGITAAQCPQCSGTILLPANAQRPANRTGNLPFPKYVIQYFSVARWPAVAGICTALLLMPVGSFLKPWLGIQRIGEFMTWIGWAAAGAWVLYFCRRAWVYFGLKIHYVDDDASDFLAVLAHWCFITLVTLLPWAVAECFTPAYGLIGMIGRDIRVGQERWLGVTLEAPVRTPESSMEDSTKEDEPAAPSEEATPHSDEPADEMGESTDKTDEPAEKPDEPAENSADKPADESGDSASSDEPAEAAPEAAAESTP